MSVPEIGRTKDAGWETGSPATDPFPRDEARVDDTNAPGGSPGSRSSTLPAAGV